MEVYIFNLVFVISLIENMKVFKNYLIKLKILLNWTKKDIKDCHLCSKVSIIKNI